MAVLLIVSLSAMFSFRIQETRVLIQILFLFLKKKKKKKIGFAIGSLIGGQLYKKYGGVISFRIFSAGALITCFAHILLRPASKDKEHLNVCKQNAYDKANEQEMEKLRENELKRIEITQSKQNGS